MKNLIKQFLIYSTGALILKIITGLSMLLAIRFIAPNQFGTLALLNNLIIFLPIILGFGFRQALALDFFGNKHYWTITWELVISYLLLAVPIILVLLTNLNFLNRLLFQNPINPYLLILVIAISFLNFFPEMLFQLLRFEKKAFLLTSIQIIMGVLLATSTMILLIFFKFGFTSILLAQLINQFLPSCYFGYLLFKNQAKFSYPNFKLICYYLKAGLPFVPNIIFAWLILASNRWLLNWHSTLSTVGIYSTSENLSLIFQTIIAQPIMHSYLPHAFASFAKNPNNIIKIDQSYQRLACYFILGLIALIPVGIIIIKPFLCIFLTKEYWMAIPLLAPLLVAQIFLAATHISSASLQYLKKTYLLTFFIAISALISILINLLLIPVYGVYSCLIAINSAYCFYFLAIYVVKKIFLPKLAPSLNTNHQNHHF